jgi:hypothetical protein
VGGVRVTRVAKAFTGFVGGVLLLVAGLLTLAVGVVVAGVGLAVAGVVAMVGFLLVYDVDPPGEAGAR